MPFKSRFRFSLGYLAAAIAVMWLLQTCVFASVSEPTPYSDFLQALQQHRVANARVGPTTVVWQEQGGGPLRVSARVPGAGDDELLRLLQDSGARFDGLVERSWLTDALGWVVPMLLMAGLWLFLLGRIPGAQQALTIGKNRAKIHDRGDVKVTFADVAGVDEAVEELREVVDFLRDPKKYQRLGGRIPKGVLLIGPPGTGKTLLARATAGEAGVPFFSLSGSEFVEMFVGVGAARVRDLFEQAAQKAPCIVFVDELDTIGRQRGGLAAFGTNEEREQTLNQLLVEMDGFDPRAGVIIMAATNRPDVLDPALLRPGRFDRQVVVDRPDANGREAILRVHARGVVLAPDVDLRVLAARTPGLAGAELANVVNEAALLAARRGKDAVGMAELDEAVDRVVAGLERKGRVLTEHERDVVAHHEMGHALVASLLPHADPVHKVTVVGRGAAALGMTLQLPLHDRYLYSEDELHDRMAVLLGGRAAEELVFGEVTTGAQNDLQQATALARRMVEEFGMSPRLGPVALALDGQGPFLRQALVLPEERRCSEAYARLADDEVKAIVERNHQRAKGLLAAHESALRALAAELKAKEVMEGRELKERIAALTADARVRTEEAPAANAEAHSL